ncbi:MAG: ATP-binding protein, partial [Candidatus Omnitrophota bacterium]
RPLDDFLIRSTDKYLFQKKYDYRHVIKEFMDDLKTMVLNMNGIAQSTVDFFMSSIRPASTAVFIYNKFTNKYDLIASSGLEDKDYKISSDTKLMKALAHTGKIIRTDSKTLITSHERDRLKELGIELIIPLLAHKELIGILCLGKKKSDEHYTEDDIGTLSDLSGALSISLKNAQLFDDRADAEKRALVGTIAMGINHEVGNPLNIITIKLETFRILAKEGMMDKKSKDEIMKEVDDIIKVCLSSAQRISEITKQVAEFAKPDRKIVLGKVNVGEAIDETIAVLKHGMILDADVIEKRFMCDPVYAVADRGQLKQILFNLIKNAAHAIAAEKGKITVSVDMNDNGEVTIKVIDNGCGMPQEVRERVFTPFFTTKDPGKGTGLGLALVKIMVDRNEGRIKVESEEAQGTTFTLAFKGGLL